MIRIVRSVLVAALAVGVPLAAVAQDQLSKRVSLDLKSMDPAEAFKVLAESVGMSVTVDPAVSAPVDIVVRNVSARTALNTMCESIGCRWTSNAAGIAVRPAAASPGVKVGIITRAPGNIDRIRDLFKRQLPAGLNFENAPFATVNERLSDATKTRITITCDDPTVQTITADVGGMTMQNALRAIMDQEQKRGSTWRITVTTADGEKPASVAIMLAGGKAKK